MKDLRKNPLTIDEVVSLFRGVQFPWWIGGGWGLDLFLEGPTRSHEDVDVLVLRRDQTKLQHHLRGWQLCAADPPGTGALRPWTQGEELQLPVHQVWCRQRDDGPWQLEIMFGETTNDYWWFRRNPAIRKRLA